MRSCRVYLGVLFSLAALALAACGGRSPLPPRSMTVELTEFAITPNMYSAQTGEPLTFVVTNQGVLDHNVTILNPSGKELAHVEVKSGQMAAFDFQTSTPGSLQIICSLDGHYKAGMSSRLMVSDLSAVVQAPSGR